MVAFLVLLEVAEVYEKVGEAFLRDSLALVHYFYGKLVEVKVILVFKDLLQD
jgi:hypothetical protein